MQDLYKSLHVIFMELPLEKMYDKYTKTNPDLYKMAEIGRSNLAIMNKKTVKLCNKRRKEVE